ncbi:Hpt domain-containing protein [Terriglobus roseus DSM 18391]|uniref:Hpt domain-containing protein n=1 Tax=Terriglobus roseus (strain DSM 18391 / NRRL B-41598 / KBS 63) TaxID=926566 RepID=I3ZLC9_TERRK|nr:Hpt domain-containing protein [Terriglobus roseus]AFL90047.1 Hpt domain-containing protein [Terriglobus roseus DSM 18391]
MTDALQASIAAIWQKSIPQTRERLAILQRAADDLANSRTIDPEQRAEALSIAHKLAGSLGMFGFNDATEHARAIELTLENDGLPQPERLEKHVAALTACMQPRLES